MGRWIKPTYKKLKHLEFGLLAQLGEHHFDVVRVIRSIRVGSTKYNLIKEKKK